MTNQSVLLRLQGQICPGQKSGAVLTWLGILWKRVSQQSVGAGGRELQLSLGRVCACVHICALGKLRHKGPIRGSGGGGQRVSLQAAPGPSFQAQKRDEFIIYLYGSPIAPARSVHGAWGHRGSMTVSPSVCISKLQ